MNNHLFNPFESLLCDFLVFSNWTQLVYKIFESSSIEKSIPPEINFLLKDNITLKAFRERVSTLYDDEVINMKLKSQLMKVKPNNCLLVLGDTGTGKSCLAQHIINSDSNVEICEIFSHESDEVNDNLKLLMNTSIAELSKQNDEKTVVLIIDSLDDFLSTYSQYSITELIALIDESTKYANIKWLITSHSIAKVIFNINYGWLSKYQFSRTDDVYGFIKSRSSNEESDLLNEWYDIEFSNKYHKVSYKVFCSLTNSNNDGVSYFLSKYPPLLANYFGRVFNQNKDEIFGKIDIQGAISEELFTNLDLNNQKDKLDTYANNIVHQLINLSDEKINTNLDENGFLEGELKEFQFEVDELSKARMLNQSTNNFNRTVAIRVPVIWANKAAQFILTKKNNSLNNLLLKEVRVNNNFEFHLTNYLIYKFIFNGKQNHKDIFHNLVNSGTSIDNIIFVLKSLDLNHSLDFLSFVSSLDEGLFKESVYSSKSIVYFMHTLLEILEERDYPSEYISNLINLSSRILRAKDFKIHNKAFHLKVYRNLFSEILGSSSRHRDTSNGTLEMDHYLIMFCQIHNKGLRFTIVQHAFIKDFLCQFFELYEFNENDLFKVLNSPLLREESIKYYNDFFKLFCSIGFNYLINRCDVKPERLIDRLVSSKVYQGPKLFEKESELEKQIPSIIRRSAHKAIGSYFRGAFLACYNEPLRPIELVKNYLSFIRNYDCTELKNIWPLIAEGAYFSLRHIDSSLGDKIVSLPKPLENEVKEIKLSSKRIEKERYLSVEKFISKNKTQLDNFKP